MINPLWKRELFPNRPDALGIFPDSQTGRTPESPYNQTRYAQALKRLIDRLMTYSSTVKDENARGKRRFKTRPQDRSRTVRCYLKAVELWSFYSVGQYGRELDPREITTDIVSEFALWMAAEGPGPDIRRMYLSSRGPDYVMLFDAVMLACARYGTANIEQIFEFIKPEDRPKVCGTSIEPGGAPNMVPMHKMLGNIIRSFRSLMKRPTSREIRALEKTIWSAREKDPLTYTYTLLPRMSLAAKSVQTHLGCMSAIWGEFSKPASPTDVPLAFNPWKSVYAEWARRARAERENALARGEYKCLTTPLVNALILACSGPDEEDRRDTLLLYLMTYMGLRSEEVCGLLRSDLREENGILRLAILGKREKVRTIDVDPYIRDALRLWEGHLEMQAAVKYVDADGVVQATYKARYCAALLRPQAPLVPSLRRWGCNDPKGRAPEELALEPLDTSGIRAIIAKLVSRARVRVLQTGKIRGFNEKEKKRAHPHAFRHYFATAAKEAGADVATIQQVLGHTNMETTSMYIAISAQSSMACAAAVHSARTRNRPLTAEQMASFIGLQRSAIADPSIIEVSPEDVALDDEISSLPVPIPEQGQQEEQQKITRPDWAYDKKERFIQYLRVNYIEFAQDNKVRFQEALRQVEHMRSIRDAEGYAEAVANLQRVQGRDLWNTMYVGFFSRLPWWAGRANTWKFPKQAPIPSYAQIAAETAYDSRMMENVRTAYATVYAEKGPTAATALVAWLGEIVHIVGVQFSLNMQDHGDAWVPFEARAGQLDRVVREHRPEQLASWLTTYGTAAYATKSKESAKHRGSIALEALATLGDWMFVEDPLTDPKHGLPPDERRQLRQWIQALQGTGPSRIRREEWLDQICLRIYEWCKETQDYETRTGKTWKWETTYSTQQGKAIAQTARDIASDISYRFSYYGAQADVSVLCATLPKPIKEATIRRAMITLLEAQGVDFDDPIGIFMSPVIPTRPGRVHVLDPALLTFNEQDTIVHPENIRKWWYERYGTDSECNTKRALRSLWEKRRKASGQLHHEHVVRTFDEELSTILPCSAEAERRIREAGWKAPASPQDVQAAFKNLWAGLVDRQRVRLGLSPRETIPEARLLEFWKEMDWFDQFVDRLSLESTVVQEGDPGAIAQVQQMAYGPDVGQAPPVSQQAVLPSAEEDEEAYTQWEEDVAKAYDEAMQAMEEEQAEPTPSPSAGPRPTGPGRPISPAEIMARPAPAEPTPPETRAQARERIEKEKARKRAQNAAATMITGPSDYDVWQMDNDKFVDIANSPDECLVFVGLPGQTAAFRTATVREVLAQVAPFEHRIFWDGRQRLLTFLFTRRDGLTKQVHIKATDSFLSSAQTCTVLEFPDSDEVEELQKIMAKTRADQEAQRKERAIAAEEAYASLVRLQSMPPRHLAAYKEALLAIGDASEIGLMTEEEADERRAAIKDMTREALEAYAESLIKKIKKFREEEDRLLEEAKVMEKLQLEQPADPGTKRARKAKKNPGWTDRQPWGARWPGYPDVDPADKDEPGFMDIRWPQQPILNPVHQCNYHACMVRYAKWKRAQLRGTFVPNGWELPSPASMLDERVPHPVDIIFAAVRGG